jgi:hypothetical protein
LRTHRFKNQSITIKSISQMNIYKPFKQGHKFGVKNTSSKYPKQNKLKIFFQTETGAQEYCDFLTKCETKDRVNPKKRSGYNGNDTNKYLFLDLTYFKPTNL